MALGIATLVTNKFNDLGGILRWKKWEKLEILMILRYCPV